MHTALHHAHNVPKYQMLHLLYFQCQLIGMKEGGKQLPLDCSEPCHASLKLYRRITCPLLHPLTHNAITTFTRLTRSAAFSNVTVVYTWVSLRTALTLEARSASCSSPQFPSWFAWGPRSATVKQRRLSKKRGYLLQGVTCVAATQ